MAWIWQTDKCPDTYGQCIRQYVIFGISGLIVILCVYSLIQIIRKRYKYKFQIIPLTLNAIAAIAMFAIFSQLQIFNTHLIMFIIQIYSYSIISYAYIGLYLRGKSTTSISMIKRWRYSFIIFSIIVFISIGTVVYLTAAGKIQCQAQHGIGTFILFIIQIPIYLSTFVFIVKTKRKIRQLQQYNQQRQSLSGQEHLLQNQDQYIKIRYRQANFVLGSFTFSLFLHLFALTVFLFVPQIQCNSEGYFIVTNAMEICILVIEDISQMIPNICMPIVFVLIPQKFGVYNPVVQITPQKVQRSMSQNRISNYQKQNFIRQKYKDKF